VFQRRRDGISAYVRDGRYLRGRSGNRCHSACRACPQLQTAHPHADADHEWNRGPARAVRRRQTAFVGGRALSTEATISFLRKVNGCTEAVKRAELPHAEPNADSRVTVANWTTCSSRAPVVLYRIDGGGHRVPS